MKGIVSSEEESVREKLFGFDEAMEVNFNADVLHCALFWSRNERIQTGNLFLESNE